jgi:hypothetical protein
MRPFNIIFVSLILVVHSLAYAEGSGGTRGGAAAFDPNLRSEFEKASKASIAEITNHTPISSEDSLIANWKCGDRRIVLNRLSGGNYNDFKNGKVNSYFVDYDTNEFIGVSPVGSSYVVVIRIAADGTPIIEYSWGMTKKEERKGGVPSLVYKSQRAIDYAKCVSDE